MKHYEINNLIILIDDLQHRITKLLDQNCQEIDGELRVKLGDAESNLYKISSLLKDKSNAYS